MLLKTILNSLGLGINAKVSSIETNWQRVFPTISITKLSDSPLVFIVEDIKIMYHHDGSRIIGVDL